MLIAIPEKYSKYIDIAITEAQIGFNKGEIPIGTVIIKNDDILSKAHNLVEEKRDTTAHSELIAIKRASKKFEKYLDGCTMITTLEPCPMCLSAIIFSRIEKVVYLLEDKIWGAMGGLYDMRVFFHHKDKPMSEYIYYKPAEDLINQFFKRLRTEK
ncbi:MAG: nucleoside deaminase [bacterium]